MSVRMYNVTITAAAQRLSVALANTERGGPADEAMSQILLTADTDCYLGDSTVTTTTYGLKLFAATASSPVVSIGPWEAGPVKLSDIWVIGTSGKLKILAFPY